MSELIEKARRTLKSIDLGRLAEAGITRIKRSYAHSHHTVTSLKYQIAEKVDAEEIFNKSSGQKNSLFIHSCAILHWEVHLLSLLFFSHIPQSKNERIYFLLKKEARLLAKTSEMQKSQIGFIYVGGGTPTYLSHKDLKWVFKTSKRKF